VLAQFLVNQRNILELFDAIRASERKAP